MVKNGQEIRRLGYEPAGPQHLDLEVFLFSELRQRVGSQHLARTHRYGFFFLFCITDGGCRTMVDFREVVGGPGSLIIVRPQQTHRIFLEDNCEGLVLLFKEDFLLPTAGAEVLAELNLVGGLAKIPEHLKLSSEDFGVVVDALKRMRMDSRLKASPATLNALLRHSVSSLLLRLDLSYCRRNSPVVDPVNLDRFARFQALVEENYSRWHQVEQYAQELGCSERSLTRATLAVVDSTAKEFIQTRVRLEAKRLLVQTGLPVASIAGMLGFKEPTNFVKFFRRAESCTPLNFRERH